MSPEVQAALPGVFRQLVTIGSDSDDTATSKQAPLSLLASDTNQRLFTDRFVASRLFQSDLADDGTPVVRIIHESLLSRWSRLQEWLIEDRELLRIRGRVVAAATNWTRQRKRADMLLAWGNSLKKRIC